MIKTYQEYWEFMLGIKIKREIKRYRNLCNGIIKSKKESYNTYYCWRDIQQKRVERLELNELEELIKWLTLKEDNSSCENKVRDAFLLPLLTGVIISMISFYYFPNAIFDSNVVNAIIFVISLSSLVWVEHLFVRICNKWADYERRFYRDCLAIAREVKENRNNT